MVGSKGLQYGKFVIFDITNNTSKCIKCKKVLRGCLSGNIRRHYLLVHQMIIHKDGTYEEDSKRLKNALDKRNNYMKTNLNKKKFLTSCVGLVADNTVPLGIFDNVHLRKLLRPYEVFFETDLNSERVVKEMNGVANELRHLISKSVFKKMICLQIDVARHMEISNLGINIQYVKDAKIIVHTIGMIQLKQWHTAQFLKKEIVNCLKKFDIDISQIYACISGNETTDVVATSKLLRELQEEMLSVKSGLKPNDEELFKTSGSICAVMEVLKCADNAINLATNEILNTIQREIEECRNIVNCICNSSVNFQIPLLDNAADWKSTFRMMKSLQDFKYEIGCADEFTVIKPDWGFIDDFVNAFKPLSECISKLHLEQYIMGDFYRDWLCCEIELEELEDNIYAKSLLASMNNLKQLLFTNNAFVSAIFLDPRFNYNDSQFLSEEQKNIAVNHLLQTQDLKKHLEQQCTEKPIKINVQKSVPTFSGNFSKLETRISLLMEQAAPLKSITNKKLEDLCEADRVPFDTNILDYWKVRRTLDPELSKLCDVVLSVPPTKAALQRSFNDLAVILSTMSANLSEETISNVLLIKLNKTLAERLINAEENGNE